MICFFLVYFIVTFWGGGGGGGGDIKEMPHKPTKYVINHSPLLPFYLFYYHPLQIEINGDPKEMFVFC